MLEQTPNNIKNNDVCNTPQCNYLKHPNINNNGGNHCCASCKDNGSHGLKCNKIDPNNKEIILVQAGDKRTGTTFLVNLLYGFIVPDKHIHMIGRGTLSIDIFSKYSIYKCHLLNLDNFIDKYSYKYDIYFILTCRNGKTTPYSSRPFKHIIFDYNELLETDTNTLNTIASNVHNKLAKFLPTKISLSKDTAITRINNMNAAYETIKTKPFTYIDLFYQLHGSHRNPEISKKWK